MEELARLLLAFLLLALLLNLINGGRQGVRGWFSAKFLGKPPGHVKVAVQHAYAAEPADPPEVTG